MKFCFSLRCRGALALVLLLALVGNAAETKSIRLRNEIIQTRKPAPAATAAATPGSGLFLVQFTGASKAEQRARLAAAGVELLRYVPDDAFIARFRGARIEDIQALPYVQWVGVYRPEHKMHRALAAGQQKDDPIPVAVLLVPRANAAEIAQARSSFEAIQQESTLRSGTVLRGKLRPARLQALARSETVLWLEPAAPIKLFDEVASKLVAGDGGPQTLLTQSLGYDGTGISVAVADSGLNNGDAATMHLDLLGRTPEFFYYGNLSDAADEHSHGTHVAGIVAGNGAVGEYDDNGALYGLGVAPGAAIIAQRIFDGEGNFESPPSFEKMTRDATRAGAVIGSNSWGEDTQGRYDMSAMEFDEFVRDADALALGDQQYIIEFSAGNAGPAPQSIGSPALAKNVLATGASENDRLDFIIYGDGPDAMADFSSRGPCEDGRIKPDVVAPGTWIASLQSASASDLFAWLPISENYQYQGGTSQAGPHVSGAAAVFVQYYLDTHTNTMPSPALVKAAFINTAFDLDDSFGTDSVPNNDEGWGAVDLTLFFDPELTVRFFDQSVMLTNDQVFEHRFVVAGEAQPLKITLAYSDAPGFPGTIPALVNDLDLEVIGPDGTVYRGNQFLDGESIANPLSKDRINNVEGVHLLTPLPGEYIVRVRGASVVADIHGEPDEPGQDFALVVSGVMLAPGVGAVALNKGAYTVPDQIKISLVDTDLAGQPSVSVQLRSATESTGESILLNASSATGSFTGSVATATGPAAADGKLQVAHNNSIEVSYVDASLSATRTASAHADLLPPVIGSPTVTTEFGESLISWTTDEPANSIVRYGTNANLASLTFAATNLSLSPAHAVVLEGLIPGRTYYYYLVSSDEAGNTGTNSNNGALFSFVMATNANLLLVDSYVNQIIDAPPLTEYTTALNQVGVSYDVWDAGTRGSPSFNNLRAYRAVLWRVPDFENAWGQVQQLAISNYLAQGGGLFVASMELLSRLEADFATNFIHNVLHVDSYVVDPGSTGAPEIIGSSIEPVGQGLDIVLDYSIYEDLWGGFIGPDISDTMSPTPNATPIFHNDVGDIVGLRWPGFGQVAAGRLILLTFPLDAVPMGAGSNDRVALLRNAIRFLAPGAGGIGDVSLDSPAYTLPSVVRIQVGDADLTGLGLLNVAASSSTETNGMNVTLVEVPGKGVFNGSFTLISATNPPTAGRLRAKSGDTITAKYVDASSGNLITASATVDTNKPMILNVGDDADYTTAVIYWDTTEEADALVQFGESALLDRTAYNSDPVTNHFVTLFGLVPDQTYYYQVVSRDLAGNTVTDPALRSFKTLLPIFAPWSDNLNQGATNWSTFSADGSQLEWTLGVPNNGLESSAHSPPAAWGSNLNGDPADYVETLLISPAIYLTNDYTAKLHFWHSYDFSGSAGGFEIEAGELQIVANNGTTVASLKGYSEFTQGWEQETVDLTPYNGQVVYLVWYYLLLSFDTFSSHPGWLVDDVSITLSNVVPGTVQITNNIMQANYILSGPLYRKGRGLGTVISNAPPGPYILEFAEIPYYVAPAAQTNVLEGNMTVAFTGNYTFTDLNSNNIPDAWEVEKFATVDPARTASTDTDQDGLSDWAEFVAGTDPLVPKPGFRLTALRLTNNLVQLSWPSTTNVSYRLHSSSNLANWMPSPNWITATGSQTAVIVSATNPVRQFYRVEAGIPAGGSGAGLFKAAIRKLPNGQLRLDWPSATGHGYRVLGSSNFTNWSPFSAWIRAGGKTTGLTLPVRTNGAPFLFRIEARP